MTSVNKSSNDDDKPETKAERRDREVNEAAAVAEAEAMAEAVNVMPTPLSAQPTTEIVPAPAPARGDVTYGYFRVLHNRVGDHGRGMIVDINMLGGPGAIPRLLNLGAVESLDALDFANERERLQRLQSKAAEES